MLGRSLFYSSISNSRKAEVTEITHNLKFLLQKPGLHDIKTETFSLNLAEEYRCSPDNQRNTIYYGTNEMCDHNMISGD